MGSECLYHVTMLVTGAQEEAIRQLYKHNNWICWLNVLEEKDVTALIETGFVHLFPVTLSEKLVAVSCDNKTKLKVTLPNNLDHINKNEIANEHIQNTSDESSVHEEADMRNATGYATRAGSRKVTSLSKETSTVRKSRKVLTTRSRQLSVSNDSVQKKHQRRVNQPKPVDTEKMKNKVQCEFCNTYINKCVMKRHCLRHHADVWFEYNCKDCTEKFKTKDELWDHRNTVKHEMPHQVPKQAQKRHHTPEELANMGHVQCSACNQYYPTYKLLRKHLFFKHRDLMPKPYCSSCDTTFETRKELWAHKKETSHNDQISKLAFYQCDDCGKILNRYDAFRKHKQYACPVIDEEALSEMRSHYCDECDHVFKSQNHLKRHKMEVHRTAPVVCDVCGLMCKNKLRLTKHKLRHDESNRKYQCEDCGKKFFKKFLLTQHTRTHTKEKPFKCAICEYSCAIQPNLRKHLLNIHKVYATAEDLKKSKDELLAMSGEISENMKKQVSKRQNRKSSNNNNTDVPVDTSHGIANNDTNFGDINIPKQNNEVTIEIRPLNSLHYDFSPDLSHNVFSQTISLHHSTPCSSVSEAGLTLQLPPSLHMSACSSMKPDSYSIRIPGDSLNLQNPSQYPGPQSEAYSTTYQYLS